MCKALNFWHLQWVLVIGSLPIRPLLLRHCRLLVLLLCVRWVHLLHVPLLLLLRLRKMLICGMLGLRRQRCRLLQSRRRVRLLKRLLVLLLCLLMLLLHNLLWVRQRLSPRGHRPSDGAGLLPGVLGGSGGDAWGGGGGVGGGGGPLRLRRRRRRLEVVCCPLHQVVAACPRREGRECEIFRVQWQHACANVHSIGSDACTASRGQNCYLFRRLARTATSVSGSTLRQSSSQSQTRTDQKAFFISAWVPMRSHSSLAVAAGHSSMWADRSSAAVVGAPAPGCVGAAGGEMK